MIRELVEVKSEKLDTYQVMLLSNDGGDGVEIHETGEVDFRIISEHLEHGGSVFITSKAAQKVAFPSAKKQLGIRRKAQKAVTAFYFDHV